MKLRKSESPAITRFPSPLKKKSPRMSSLQKKQFIASRFQEIMECLGLDLNDPSLAKTPERIAEMYVDEIFSGLEESNFPDITFVKDEFQHERKAHLILSRVSFTSFCEHHFVPIHGIAYVGYIPSGKLIGLSKIPRIVRYFAKRPQLQERFTSQIADSLSLLLDTEDVAVSVIAQHFCVIARGVEDEASHTLTNVLRGRFETSEALRQEFFEGINRQQCR